MKTEGPFWSGSVRPAEDELLSSWMVRASNRMGISVYQLATLAMGNDSAWCRDIDLHLSAEHVRRIGAVTGCDPSSLLSINLAEKQVAKKVGITPGVLAYGVYHRSRRLHGLQYCPVCLKTDPIPYFRQEWRISIQFGCYKHAVELRDGCPRCDAPVVPHRSRGGSVTNCVQCGADLRAQTAQLTPSVASFCSAVHQLYSVGAGQYGTEIVPWSEMLTVMRATFCFISGRGAPAELLIELGKLATVEVPSLDRTGVVPECMRVSERAKLIPICLQLLGSGPEALIEWCRTYSIPRNRLWLYGRFQVPAWFERHLEALPAVERNRRRCKRRTKKRIAFKVAFAKVDLDAVLRNSPYVPSKGGL